LCAAAFLACARFHHGCSVVAPQRTFSGRVYVLEHGRLHVELGGTNMAPKCALMRLA